MINPEAIALNNILSLFENKYYSKREAADIVGGRKKLESLIEANKIEAIKNNPTQKGNGIAMRHKCCGIAGQEANRLTII